MDSSYSKNNLTSGWSLLPIKDLVTYYRAGGTPRRSNKEFWDNGMIPFAMIEDLTKGLLYLRDTKDRITEEGLEHSSAWLIPPGSVLVSMYATIGATAINQITLSTNQAILALILKPEYCAEFVAYSINYHKDLLSMERVESTQKNVNKAIVGNFKLPIPPLPEQRRIAAVLSAVQRAIEQQEELIARTTELKKALMHKLFTEGTRGEPQKETEIGPVPESWEVVEIGSLLDIKHGYAFKGEYFREAGEFILMTPGSFHEDGGFRYQGEKTKYYVGEMPEGYLLTKGDLLVAMTEQKSGLLGSSAIVPESNRYLHNQRLGLVTNLNESKILKSFLYYIFNLPDVRRQISLTATGSKVRHTSPGKIKNIKIVLPNIFEQSQIVEPLSILEIRLDLLSKQLFLQKDLFHTLLHQLMTAEIRVNEVDLSELREIGIVVD